MREKGFIIATKDQCLPNNSYNAKINKNGSNLPVVDARNLMKPLSKYYQVSQFMRRKNTLLDIRGKEIYSFKCLFDLWVFNSLYIVKHQQNDVTNGDGVTILCKFPILTDRKIDANRPATFLKKNKNRFQKENCQLIDDLHT